MSEPCYSFFRPIVAANRNWVAFDWQCTRPRAIDGELLAHWRAQTCLAELAKLLPMVAIADATAADDTALLNDPLAEHIVLTLPATTLDNTAALTRCSALRRQGRHFALCIEDRKTLGEVPYAFDHLWIDAALARQEFSASDFVFIDEAGLQLIASGVDSHEMFGWLADKGFAWSASRFLTTHNPLNAREPDLARLKLLKLLNLVRQDGDTRVLEEIFRQEPKLSYNLLRLVNSVALGSGTKITNFAQAITMLGRRQLQRWLQMLVYADHLADGITPNPLMQLAARRARQMELLSATLAAPGDDAEFTDNAFMTGLFSLLEVLINLPTKEIIKEIPIHDAAADALINHGRGGILGQLLAGVIAGENGDFHKAEKTLRGLGIDADAYASAQLAALHWAVSINIDLNA